MRGTLDQAQALHLQGRLSEAAAQYRRVLEWQPDDVEAIRGLGALAYQHGRVDEAVAFFARGVSIRPDAADFHANLAESLRIANRPDQAFEHAHKALALDCTLPDAWNTFGLLEHDRGRYTKAETAFEEALRLRPKYASAHANLGNALAKLGRFDDAAAALRNALGLEPKNAGSLTNLAQLLIEMGDVEQLDDAKSLLERALIIAPTLTQAINSLGNVFRGQSRFDDAASCYLSHVGTRPAAGDTLSQPWQALSATRKIRGSSQLVRTGSLSPV